MAFFRRKSTTVAGSYADQRRQMVAFQLRARDIRDQRVLAAMGRVPRERFLPDDRKPQAYCDGAVAIDCQQTISQPYVVAATTQALELRGPERVLEIGTGSGYQAAVLAELVTEVQTIERHQPLMLQAQALLTELGYRNIHFHHGDGALGFAEAAPYDRIVVTAASETCPPRLWDQLAEDGILVGPFGPPEAQTLRVIRKRQGRRSEISLFAVRFVPLVSDIAPANTDREP